jgi:hypothetical protein
MDDISQKLDAHIARQVALCQERAKAAATERQRHEAAIVELQKELDAMQKELIQLRLASAVQAVKIGMWAALGASVPTIALGIIFLLSR